MYIVNGNENLYLPEEGPNFYNTDKGLRNWRVALAKAKAGEGGIVNLNFLGDSNTEGYGTSTTPADFATKGYVGRIRTRFASSFGDCGLGFIAPAFPYGEAFWELGAGWQVNTSYGWGVAKTNLACGVDDANIIIDFTGTGFTIIHATGTSLGKYTWKIDSGSETEVDCAGSMGAGNTVITGLTSGVHTLTIKKYADAKSIFLFGGYPTTDVTCGVRINNLAKYGQPLESFVSTSDFVNVPQINYWQAKLTVIALVAIDANAGTNELTYETNMRSLITRCKAYGDVLLLNNAVVPAISNETANKYGNILKNLAFENDCAYANYVGRMVTNSGLLDLGVINTSDEVHLNAVGAQDLATWLLNILLEER